MDRLLSEQEMREQVTCVLDRNRLPIEILTLPLVNSIAKAQLVKADKEWIEWIEEAAKGCTGKYGMTICPYADPCCGFIKDCGRWQERKRSIGI